jgi:hypothetical protein
MPGQRLPVRKIRDVLRLHAGGISKRKIAASLAIGATAAGDCIRRARRAGLIWPPPEDLSDAALERLLYPPPLVAAKDRRAQPDWAEIHRELRRPGVTLQLLWEEHRGVHPDGYGYSVRALEFFGGVTAHIVSDNLRSGVEKGPIAVRKLERMARQDGLLRLDQEIGRCSTFRRIARELKIESKRTGYRPGTSYIWRLKPLDRNDIGGRP